MAEPTGKSPLQQSWDQLVEIGERWRKELASAESGKFRRLMTGEWPADQRRLVTCINGHPLYLLSDEFQRGMAVCSRFFQPVNRAIERPAPGTRMGPCPICGAAWHRILPGGTYQFHFEDGWR